MIIPPAGIQGTSSNPITIRALNDGQVLIDAENNGFALWLAYHGGGANDNAWFVVEGINATRGDEATLLVSGSDNILSRVIGYNGTDTQNDSNIFRIVGFRSRAVDCAGWGNSSRKIFDGAQAGNLDTAGFKRCWGEWNDWPGGGSWPSNTYQGGYNSFDQLHENVLGTTRITGNTPPGDFEGVMRYFHGTGIPPFDMQGSRMLGAIFYTTPGVANMGDSLLSTDEVANLYFEDVALIVDPGRGTSVQPYFMTNCIVNGQCFNNVCQNCLFVDDGAPGFASGNSGWSFPNVHQGNSLAAATGGTSPFVLLPGICKRYENGVLTSTPLWPWPMNQRILDARATSGFPAVDVTATIESILGTIPAACRSDGGDTTPPTVSITAPSNGATVSGALVSVTANASDNVGVVGVQFKLDGVNIGAEDTVAPYAITWNTTSVANGAHALTAVARDAATNTTTSAAVNVTVDNAVAGHYYVSTTGSNGNSGTSAGNAWATLQHAHDTVVAGNTIHVLAGQYFQRVTITKNNLTWTGESGTIIDGSDALTGWSSQGSGMYRVAFPGYAPGALIATANKLSLGRIKDSMMAGTPESCGTGFQVLQSSSSFVCEGRTYWDGWEASFGNNGGFVYIRFRNGENPNTMQVRSSPGDDSSTGTTTGTFTLNGADGNIIENMEIGGGTDAILLYAGANNNIIRNNTLRNGVHQVRIHDSSGNTVLNNTMSERWIGSHAGYAATPMTAGDWWDPTFGDARINQYHHDKFEGADGGEHTGGIYSWNSNDSIFDGNTITGGTVGIHFDAGGTGTHIRNNYIANHSAEGVYFSEYDTLHIYNNRFYNGSHLMRIQRMEFSGKTGYIYRNHFHQDFPGSKHVHLSFIERIPSTNTLYFYHNTFTGGGFATDCGCGDFGTVASMENVRVVNNILTGPDMNISSHGLNGNPGTTGYIGMWSYNHVSNGDNIGGANNYVNNTTGGVNPIWNDPLNQVLLPPSGHAAENSAIRLDQTWTIGGTPRSALPGMAGGYYPDTTPHKGRIQVAEGGDITPPVVSITAPANGAAVSGTSVAVTANASDNVGVAGVQFKLDGANLGAEDTTFPYGIVWNTTLASNGAHILTAVARDAAGNTATSTGVGVTVTGGVGLTVSPTTVSLGESVTATWSNIVGPTSTDWIGLYAIGADNLDFLTFEYTDGTANGSLAYPIPPAPFAIGNYELRLFANDVFTLLATSETLTVDDGTLGFLGNPTGVSISAAATPTFLGNPIGVSVSAGAVPAPLGDPSGVSISAAAVPTFLGVSTSVGIVASAAPTFLGNPTNVSVVFP